MDGRCGYHPRLNQPEPLMQIGPYTIDIEQVASGIAIVMMVSGPPGHPDPAGTGDHLGGSSWVRDRGRVRHPWMDHVRPHHRADGGRVCTG